MNYAVSHPITKSRPRFRHLPLVAVLLAGLAVRLVLAPITAPYSLDMGYYVRWARAAVETGLASVYSQTFCDYPPGILWLLYGQGWLAEAWGWSILEPLSRRATVWLKLPSLLADVLAALVVYIGLRRQGRERTAFWAATLWALHPAPIYISSLWGQTDALYTLPLLVSAVYLKDGSVVGGWAALTLGVFAKLQAVSGAPLALALTLRRGWRGLVAGGVAALAVALGLSLPWLLAGRGSDIARVYLDATTHTQQISVSAYNLWYLLWGGNVHRVSDTGLWLGLTYRVWGMLLAAGYAAFITLRLAYWKGKPPSVGAGLPSPYLREVVPVYLPSALLALALFSLPTEIHERYMLAALPLLLLALPETRLAWPAFISLSLTFTFNLITINPVVAWLPANLVATPGGDGWVGTLKGIALLSAVINVGWLVLLTIGFLRPTTSHD